MITREEMLTDFYGSYDENVRLDRTRHGQLEYTTTMNYIHRYVAKDSRILEIGAGTGKYSISLARENLDVTAVELVDRNLKILRNNSVGISNIRSFQGDATNLSRFENNSFDVTLVMGPMYHLFDEEDVNRAIDEAIRVTRKGGVIMFAFISVYAIMYSDYLKGNWTEGQKTYFSEECQVKHFQGQLFTGYDVCEFESLFNEKNVEWIVTTGVDGLLEPMEQADDFCITDADFKQLTNWYMKISDKRELLGMTNHLLYICRKI